MTLEEFKKHIQSNKQGTVFNYGISEPFAWRGSYSEVAFKILDHSMTREEILENIGKAYQETFYGYKGGEYKYDDYTEVNFEEGTSEWTDGGYTAEWIAKIENYDVVRSQEERLVKLLF